MDDAEDTNLPQASAGVAVLKYPAGTYLEAGQLGHAANEPLRNDPRNASQRIPQQGASGIASGVRGEPSGAVANHGYASSNVHVVREYSQVVDTLYLAPVKQSRHWPKIFSASPSGLKKDALIQVAPPKKLTIDNQVSEYTLPPRKSIRKNWAQGKARAQRWREKQTFESVERESGNASQRIPQQGAYGVGRGGGGVPFRADYDTHRNSVANHSYASSEVPMVRRYSHVVDEAAQVIDTLSHAPVQEATLWSATRSPSRNNIKIDAPVEGAETKKLTIPNHFPECSLPPLMNNIQIGAQDAARPYLSSNEETRNSSRRNPQVGSSGVRSSSRGALSRSDYNVHRNSDANHGYPSSKVPVVRAFTQDEYKAAQVLLKLRRASIGEDKRSAEIIPPSPSRMTTDAPIQVAAPVKLSFTNQVAEISQPPRKVIDTSRAQNPGQPNTVAPASTIRVRKAARLQRVGGGERSAVEQAATPRFAPRTKTNYRPAGEGEDRPFKCIEAGCKSSFNSNGHLQQHIRTVHKGERPYICKEVLKVKDRRVTKRDPCRRGFASPFALKQVRLHFMFQF